jgi:alcohol dehydrogenase
MLTAGRGVDVAIEAVGIPETFELCADIVRAGGHVANVGVHGSPATLHLERLWIRDITITMGLVDTFSTPRLMELIRVGRLDSAPFATHRFALADAMDAYDAFADAASTGAFKVVLEGEFAPLTEGRRPSAALAVE